MSCLCRYFAETAATLACMVFGVRDGAPADAAPTRDYWITDGALIRLLPWPRNTCLSMKLCGIFLQWCMLAYTAMQDSPS